jgi:hypothetical protein
MIWARMLAYITGTVDQELLLRNECSDKKPWNIGDYRETGYAAGLVSRLENRHSRTA